MNYSTAVDIFNLKNDVESKKIDDFGDDLTKYITWVFTHIIVKEKVNGYNDFLRSISRTY